MAILYFSDVLKKVGIDPAKVKLIRHAIKGAECKPCYEKGFLWEYTRVQKKSFAKGYDYWAVFIGDAGTQARFYGLYRSNGFVPAEPELMPAEFPYPDWFTGEKAYFNLEPVPLLQEYEERLIIEWGTSTKSWHQKGTVEKPVLSIQERPVDAFCGYENLILSFDRLRQIVENQPVYEAWHTALKSVKAVYLIVDMVSGQQYVGSAYGNDGLLGRWTEYIKTKHGGNKMMRKLLQDDPERYHAFQFSILQVLPKTVTPDEALQCEMLYKQKLLTREFGLNEN